MKNEKLLAKIQIGKAIAGVVMSVAINNAMDVILKDKIEASGKGLKGTLAKCGLGIISMVVASKVLNAAMETVDKSVKPIEEGLKEDVKEVKEDETETKSE